MHIANSNIAHLPKNIEAAKARYARLRRARQLLNNGNRLKYTRGPLVGGTNDDGPSAA